MHTPQERKRLKLIQINEWRKKNPEKVNSYARIWRERNKERHLENKRSWEKKNRIKIAENQRLWRQKNKEKVSEYQRVYRKSNGISLKSKFSKYKSNAKKRGYEFNISYEEFIKILDNAHCEYCGASGQLGLDRVINSIGYQMTNIVPCCWPCNRQKRIMSKENYINLCIAVAKNQK